MTPLKLSAAAAAMLLAACAGNPPANDALEQARAAVQAAQADPGVTSLAAAELDMAQRTLNDAERLSREGRPAEYVSHRAYVAEQRARIARETAAARATEVELARAREARRERLEARARAAEEQAREAHAAQERAEALAREAQARASALEQARQAEQSRRLAASEQLGAEVRRLEAQLPELVAREGEGGWVLTLGAPLLFASGDATLRPGGRRAIDNVARLLRQHPERHVLIEGFTDEGGGDDLNRRLSERRAQAVRNALVLAGVDAERIVARGLGNAYPLADAKSRVEIVIAQEPASAATGGSR